MRVVDKVILDRLNAIEGVVVHDGEMELTPDDVRRKIVSYDLPYAVYYSSVGDDDKPRKSGRRARRSVFFSITFVGGDRNQAKALGEKIRASLQDKPIAVPGHKSWLCRLADAGGGASQRIRRDDEVMRPGGEPLFYGNDSYALPITLVHTD